MKHAKVPSIKAGWRGTHVQLIRYWSHPFCHIFDHSDWGNVNTLISTIVTELHFSLSQAFSHYKKKVGRKHWNEPSYTWIWVQQVLRELIKQSN